MFYPYVLPLYENVGLPQPIYWSIMDRSMRKNNNEKTPFLQWINRMNRGEINTDEILNIYKGFYSKSGVCITFYLCMQLSKFVSERFNLDRIEVLKDKGLTNYDIHNFYTYDEKPDVYDYLLENEPDIIVESEITNKIKDYVHLCFELLDLEGQ